MAEKSRWQIHMDLARARAQADNLEDAAKSIRTECNRFKSCRSDVRQSWEGDNATRFISKMGIVEEDLEKIAQQLQKTAHVIRKNAKNIYEAEMEAKRIAETRSHS